MLTRCKNCWRFSRSSARYAQLCAPRRDGFRRTARPTVERRPFCPHCRRKVRLSLNSATVAVFCDSLTFVRQCGQGLTRDTPGQTRGTMDRVQKYFIHTMQHITAFCPGFRVAYSNYCYIYTYICFLSPLILGNKDYHIITVSYLLYI